GPGTARQAEPLLRQFRGGAQSGRLELLGAFLVAPRGAALGLARGGRAARAVDGRAEIVARAVEPHRELAHPRHPGAGGRALDGPKLAAHLAQPLAAGLEHLHAPGRLRGDRGGEAVLDPADPGEARALADEPVHCAIIWVRAATESAKLARSFGAWVRKSSNSGRRTIASSI